MAKGKKGHHNHMPEVSHDGVKDSGNIFFVEETVRGGLYSKALHSPHGSNWSHECHPDNEMDKELDRFGNRRGGSRRTGET